MSDKIVLRGREVGIRSKEGKRFVVDSARAADGLLTDADLCRMYELSFAELEAAVANETFKKALNAKRVERMKDGTTTKELAAQHLIEGPKRSDSIMVNGTLQPEIECEVKAAGSAKESVSAFRTFIADSLKEERREVAPPVNLRTLPAGKLLYWLLNRWDEPTITAKEIYTYGPRPVKNSKEAVSAAKILVEQGWLIEIRPERINQRIWQIVQGKQTSADVAPAVGQPSYELSAY